MLLLALLLLSGCGDAPPASGSAPVETSPAPAVSASAAPTPTPTPTPEPPPPTVATLAVCGDAMSHNPVRRDAWNEAEGHFDYGRIMGGARAAVSAADYAVVNLETPLAGGPNYSGYPMFNAPDDLAWDLKELGFDLCLTANNHCLDKGFGGLSRTLDAQAALDAGVEDPWLEGKLNKCIEDCRTIFGEAPGLGASAAE